MCNPRDRHDRSLTKRKASCSGLSWLLGARVTWMGPREHMKRGVASKPRRKQPEASVMDASTNDEPKQKEALPLVPKMVGSMGSVGGAWAGRSRRFVAHRSVLRTLCDTPVVVRRLLGPTYFAVPACLPSEAPVPVSSLSVVAGCCLLFPHQHAARDSTDGVTKSAGMLIRSNGFLGSVVLIIEWEKSENRSKPHENWCQSNYILSHSTQLSTPLCRETQNDFELHTTEQKSNRPGRHHGCSAHWPPWFGGSGA